MFSDEDAYKVLERQINYKTLFERYLEEIANEFSFLSVILCAYGFDEEEIGILASYNISTASFLKSNKIVFFKTIEECLKSYPKPHIHKLNEKFKKVLTRIEPSKKYGYSIIFIPLIFKNHRYIFLGFPTNSQVKAIPEDIYLKINDVINAIDLLIQSEIVKSDFSILQKYVKEVGHDISSGVQATVAKLRNISRGLYTAEKSKIKAKEAEEEILGTYRIAENLGIIVDPNYNIKGGNEFDLIESVESVINHYKSEADERGIKISINSSTSIPKIWGDERGIESSIGQYLFNAIKYAYGSSNIKIRIFETANHIHLEITDNGIPLSPVGRNKIWDFGYRGMNAKEMHVNGAGIGLYTTKKVIEAHGGNVYTKINDDEPNHVIFGFALLKKIMRKFL